MQAKHDFPRNSTERGITIDLNEQQVKHCSSIRVSNDSDSNSNTSMAERPKQDSPRISTERGMQIALM
jgi:hypothetical protein